MTTLPDAEKNYLADQQAARISHYSIHTGATGTTGANEASGGGYARVASNFNSAGTAGPLGSALQPATPGVAYGSAIFTVSAGTYPEVGGWSASSSGTFRGGDDLTSPVVMSAGGSTPALSIKVGPGA